MNRSFSSKDYQNIVRRYQKGETSYQIAKTYGVRTGTISRILKRSGVNLRTDRKALSAAQELSAVEMYSLGASSVEVAREHGCHPATVRNILRRHNQAPRRRGGTLRVFSNQQEQEIVRLYAKENLSQSLIAARFGCSQGLVSNLLRSKGMATRRASERHPSWKGGRRVHASGYVQTRLSYGHPFYCMVGRAGYVFEHRLVMAQHLGRPLSSGETVHHINGVRTDNRIENLQIRQGSHGKGAVYRCCDCGSLNVTAAPVE